MQNTQAIKHLSLDPVMKKLIKIFGSLPSHKSKSIFEDIVESIISQQLSVKVSDTIYKRFLSLFGGKFPDPDTIIQMPDEKIRECGVSFSKIKYIKGIAEAVIEKSFEPEKLASLSDDIVLEKLVELKGIGPWTAEMLLIFTLQRPDVFSMGDIGLRNTIAKLYKVNRDDLKKIKKISDQWRPYRSLACRYLWKSLDNEPVSN